jgi:hypothetical protein
MSDPETGYDSDKQELTDKEKQVNLTSLKLSINF